jgi:hypothetical protein
MQFPEIYALKTERYRRARGESKAEGRKNRQAGFRNSARAGGVNFLLAFTSGRHHLGGSMNLRHLAYAIFAGSALLLTGCASHYMVRDPTSGTTYYTTDLDTPGGAGTVRFKDGRTDAEVVLQSSEVTPISREEYRRNINAR